MFNDRVRRYRLTTLLVLAVLVLSGLGAGHLATRALGAQGGTSRASAVFGNDFFGNRPPDGLQSDGGGDYVDGEYCVENYVLTTGLWRLTTPVGTCSPAPRAFKLVLDPVPGTIKIAGCSVSPALGFGTGSLSWDTCGGSNVVWAQVKAPAFSSQPGKSGTYVYIRTDSDANPGSSPAFVLEYREALTVTRPPSGTESIVTTDGVSPWADLYKHIPTRPYWTLVGTFSVPCWIKVKKL